MLRALSSLGRPTVWWAAGLRRPSALVASFAIHAGAIAAGGHGIAGASKDLSRADLAWQRTIEVELEPPPEPTPVSLPADTVASTHGKPSPVTHRHSYPVAPSHDARPHEPSLVHLPLAPQEQAAVGAAPDVIEASHDAPVHFVLPSVRAVAGGTGIVSAGGSRHDGAGSEHAAPTTYDEADVSTPARLLSSAPVDYPDDARAAQIETDVEMELIVDVRGRVVVAKGVSTRGFGLEKAAARAVQKYLFSPAIRHGHPVSVRMRWTVQFRLK
jgi:protein TonB